MKAQVIQVLKILVPVALGIYLVAHIYGQLTADQRLSVYQSFSRANYAWVFLSFSMGLLSHYLRGFRWSYQFEALNYQTRPLNNFMAVMIGYFVNMALPRVGEVSRAAAISRYEGIPFQKSFGTILAERALDLIILLSILAFTLFLQYDMLSQYLKPLTDKIRFLTGSATAWIFLVMAALAFFGGLFLLKRYRHVGIIAKLLNFVEGLLEGLRSLFRMRNRSKYLLCTAGIWMLYVGMFWVCNFSLEETSHLGPNAVFAAFVVGSFAVVLIPGGIGAFPVGIMQSLALYGVAPETGFALGWIIWLSQTILVLLVGGICLAYIPIYNKTRNHGNT